jgi:hypothetical protein
MPRAKKADWERVTLTLSGECVRALRVLSGISGAEMGATADKALRKGGLLSDLDYALGKDEPGSSGGR